MTPNATLQDVARIVGLHRTTVSLSLHDHPRIPKETRDRVRAAALQLGYRMDPHVSALMQSRRRPRSGGPHTLAFLSHRTSRRTAPETAPDYFTGAAQRAREFGFQLERYRWDATGPTAREFSDRLSQHLIRGVIIDRTPPDASPGALEWDRFSTVALGVSPHPPALHHVTENPFDAVEQAMNRCRERGYRRIGLVLSASSDNSPLADRAIAAYALEQLHTDAPARLPVCPGEPVSAATFGAWFSAHRPEALLVDRPADVVGWLQRLGRAPREIGLVSLQRRRAATCSGFYWDPAQTGATAVELVLGLMHRRDTGVPIFAQEISLTGVWRECGTLPVRDLFGV